MERLSGSLALIIRARPLADLLLTRFGRGLVPSGRRNSQAEALMWGINRMWMSFRDIVIDTYLNSRNYHLFIDQPILFCENQTDHFSILFCSCLAS